MKRNKKFIPAILFFITTLIYPQSIIKIGNSYMLRDVVVVKFRPTAASGAYTNALNKRTKSALNKLGVYSIRPRFKISSNPTAEELALSQISILKFSAPINPLLLSAKIASLPQVEWAEPYYLQQIQYVPSDTYLNKEWYLKKIKAINAWDVNKGDSKIIIGIVDTGVDWKHPDLADNIWTNKNETPGNNTDDDNNGYVDDVHGWDFGGSNGTPDNDPMEDKPDHGTNVAGIASAVTDNGYGVASIGFNSTIMPVKASRNDVRDQNGNALIYYGYDGIKYAVDNGAKIINCSWGGYDYSNAAQQVIDYAVKKGALIVGAAGNENFQGVIYPAHYFGALAVGATDSNDYKAYFSNFGEYIDVMAPGVSIFNTWQPNTFATLSGTSMASPLTAGLAALVANQFPNYSPLQIAEQIRVNCDNIDATNPSKKYLLGSGRINAYKALTNTSSKSLRIFSYSFDELTNPDGIFDPGDRVKISITFVNYLNPLTSPQITLLSKTPYANVTQGSFSAGAIGTNVKFNNNSSPFEFTIAKNVPSDYTLKFLLKYSDGNYNDFEWLTLNVNPSYRNQNANDIKLTVTSKGTLGFNDYPSNLQGEGFEYQNGPNLLFEGALLYGTSEKTINDCARDATGDAQDDDFNTLVPFKFNSSNKVAQQEGFTSFDDSKAGANSLGIKTNLFTYSFTDSSNNNYVILKYVFQNKSDSIISNFHAGLFLDWDMDEQDYADNIAAYDSAGNFGYAYNSDYSPVSTLVACALLTKGNYNFYPIVNAGTDGGINIYDGFDDSEKWLALTNGIKKKSAGPEDISFVAGAGNFTILPDSTLTVAFALAAANSMTALRNAVSNAKAKYNQILITAVKEKTIVPDKFNLSQNYPNPFNPTTTIEYSLPASFEAAGVKRIQLKIYDLLGREVATLVNKNYKPGNYRVGFNASNLTSGIYFYRLTAGKFSITKKMLLLR